MPKSEDDLFTRLRRAGVRKPVAKRLSELSEDAGKKAIGAGHRAVAELRALADEIERRLPMSLPAPEATAPPAPVSAPSRLVTPAKAPKRAPASRPRKTAAPSTSTTAAPAPRGENKAKILAALKTGPQTASEIGQATGITTATVSAALTRLSKAGEVTKATRGYALPI